MVVLLSSSIIDRYVYYGPIALLNIPLCFLSQAPSWGLGWGGCQNIWQTYVKPFETVPVIKGYTKKITMNPMVRCVVNTQPVPFSTWGDIWAPEIMSVDRAPTWAQAPGSAWCSRSPGSAPPGWSAVSTPAGCCSSGHTPQGQSRTGRSRLEGITLV